MASQIPPLIEAYLSLPREAGLILLTGILGASTNWLTLRYIYSFLRPAPSPLNARQHASTRSCEHDEVREGSGGNDDAGDDRGHVAVLLVSFMRDYEFWKEGAGRLGLDLDALARQGRFAFVDGLSSLFSPTETSKHGLPASGRQVLAEHKTPSVTRVLSAAIDKLAAGGGKVVVVLDQPDLLLAAAPESITHVTMLDMMSDLREKIHAAVITLAADSPLMEPQKTTLEREHAALVLSLAHQADLVVSLRLLDTGVADDVSGVVRITAGGAESDSDDEEVEEKELLYWVGGDGGVKVFERGQGH